MTNKIRTRTWALISVGIIGVVAIALIASSGDDPSPNDSGASASAVSGSESTTGDTEVDTDATANATEGSDTGGSTNGGGTTNGSATTTNGGSSVAVTTTKPAGGGPVATSGTGTTTPNAPTTITTPAGPGATTAPTAAVPGTTSPTLQLFFLSVSTGQCDASGHFEWSVDLLSTLTPIADPAPDRVVHNPTNARGWDMYWTVAYNGRFTSPLTVIAAGRESFTVPIGEAAQPTNCP